MCAFKPTRDSVFNLFRGLLIPKLLREWPVLALDAVNKKFSELFA